VTLDALAYLAQLGLPGFAVVVMLWRVDRRLVRIETHLFGRGDVT
jgi:hypothetical protein